MISKSLSDSGPDKHYTFISSEDLRPYNISAYFILQVNLYINHKLNYTKSFDV